LWFLLPLSVGFVLRDAIGTWPSATAMTAAVLLYAAWVAGLVALVAVHPWSFTVLRVVAPSAAIITIVAVRWATFGIVVLAVVHAIAATVCCLHGSVAEACTQSAAYGDEVRRPLRTPPPLCLLLAIVVPITAAGISSGPLLLANGGTVWGIVCLVVGLPLAALLLRSLNSLTGRFLVFVPAGLALSDPLTLPDPVLLPREKILRLHNAPPRGRVDGVDARLGAVAGAIVILLDEPGTFTVRRGRGGAATREASSVWCTPQRPSSVLAIAAERHVGAVKSS
jgi:hypothetical protein